MLKGFCAARVACRFAAIIMTLWLTCVNATAQDVITLPSYFEITQQNTMIGSLALSEDRLLDTEIVTFIDGQLQYNLQNATDPNSTLRM